jgi:predicted ferric reductase
LPYEAWQQLHGVAALAIVLGAIAHVLAVDRYASAPVVRWLVVFYGALFIGLLVGYRVLRPLWLWRRPWIVTDNRDVGGDTRLVRLAPAGAWRCRFEPGQFAWLITGRTPFALEQHPLSLASSAELDADGSVEFAIKALGDWSRTVARALVPGTGVWIDGPYGAFTPDRAPGQGLVLIAGGIGVSPMRAMLRTMRDREDHRPVLLVLAARNWCRVPLRDDLVTLASELPLRIVYVLEDPPAEWRGERGFVTADILRRHLPPHFEHYQYFICGPPAMMNTLEPVLRQLGVPRDRVHTERFDMV